MIPDAAAALLEDGPAGVNIRFKGLTLSHLDSAASMPIAPADIPDLEWLIHRAQQLRALEPMLAFAALRSVRGRPEMRFLRGGRTRHENFVELPAEYIRTPPTKEVAIFIAVDAATHVLEHWIDIKAAEIGARGCRRSAEGQSPARASKSTATGSSAWSPTCSRA